MALHTAHTKGVVAGHDGGVYVADWTDVGECHENDGVHRESGRIYKITYGRPAKPAIHDVGSLRSLELVALQTHGNDWFSRHARRVLHERACAGEDMTEVRRSLLLMLEPNLGTTIIIAAVLMVMMFVGGVGTVPLAGLLGILGAGAAFFAFSVPFRFRRLMAYGDPWKDAQGTGYQALQSRIGLANGGIFGLGLGSSRVKWGYLPEADTDFILAIIGEELGLIGCTVIVGLLLAFGCLGVQVALHAPDRMGMLLATGITTWIMIQAFVNIGAVVGAIPITGVPLPFVSAGGSSLIFTMAGVGILLNVAKRTT
jgi:hypothetical protein